MPETVESETVCPGPCVRLSVKTAVKERVSETVCPRPCVRGRASETVVRDESEKIKKLRTRSLAESSTFNPVTFQLCEATALLETSFNISFSLAVSCYGST